MTPFRHPAGMPDQTLGMIIAINPHQQAPAQRGCRLPQLAIAFVQLVVDVHRRSLHGQLTQGVEVGLGEKRINRSPCLFRHIDFAVAQTLKQFPRRQVDQQQLVGFLHDPVGQGFAHLHPSNTAHLVVKAF